ncbi:MAG: recombinase zinc beta ribbon domain-containing protein [Acetobacteraceae bacterium]|nr:recombinase zinc beta ribbon domain-containing protein [Acetobacteraceae bacterium]
MTLRTGRSGRYRYYTCASAAHRGNTVCPGRSVPMDDLDQLVIGAFAERVLRPERLEALLSAYIARSAEADTGRRERLARLKKEATEAAGAKTRLMKLVASGALEADDPDLIEQLKEADARRRRAEEEIGLLEAQAGAAGPKVITPAKIAKLATAIRSALETGAPEFRRAYLRLFVGRVTVGDEEIRISGPTATLARASGVYRHLPERREHR